jgi:alanyl-tRNA synthetase
MMTSADIRQAFLDFFRSKGHEIVPSAPIVVKDDPTLMFTNAGMNQFKDYFLGNKKAPYPRIADTQKCLRVSGKHNDLEEVGVDTYHHTMFEMLGNWSFGDPAHPTGGYFKKEAIEWSWELLTNVYNLDKSRLYVTIFEGDQKEGLSRDDEAYNEWKKWIPEDRILNGNKKDNFWEMGDTGPCGPCTEIHYDTRPEANNDGHSRVNNDDTGMVMEIWNNVFIEFERYWNPNSGGAMELKKWENDNIHLTLDPESKKVFDEKRKQKHLDLTLLKDLPAKHVDTGMGLERLVRVIQNKNSNYDSDIFSGIIAKTEKITGKKYDYGESKKAVAFRVIADHIRAISFIIADRQLPSSGGAGYVIRRILRRAVRYYYSYLDYKKPLLAQLVPLLAQQFEFVFPELFLQSDFVSKVVKEEEEAFLRTLEKGLKRIEDLPKLYWMEQADIIYGDQYDPVNSDKANYLHNKKNLFVIEKIKENLPIKVSGKIAFELYDTFGFPLDLTKLIIREYNWDIDEIGFNKEMQQQKNRSRTSTSVDAGDWKNPAYSMKMQNDNAVNIVTRPGGQDLYWESESISTHVFKYRSIRQKDRALAQIVLFDTPFYAESGGQVGDTGVLIFGNEKINVIDTKKENDLIVHVTDRLPSDNIIMGEASVFAKIDVARRKRITAHHSATHLLHSALRKILGDHVVQKGSLVNEEHLRFDFSHFAKMTSEEILQVETLVNEKIRENIPVIINQLPKDEAMKLGAMALFGEKYGDIVRVVTIDPSYSVELCGGAHVGATGELGLFKITSESGIASGVRRVEAICGRNLEIYINDQISLIESISTKLKNPKDLPKAIENLQSENAELKKHLESMEARQLVVIRNELLQKDEIVNGVNFIGDIIEVSNAEALKKLCFDLKHHVRDHVAVLCVNIDGKPFVAVGISDTVAAARNLDAGKIIKEHIAPLIKGGGGGQKTLATAGGQDISNLAGVIAAVKNLL